MKVVTKSEQFVMLVQTTAIVESLSRTETPKHVTRRTLAMVAVSVAMKVPEASLPQDLSEACDDLINHIFEDTVPKPRWLIGII